MQGDLQSSGWHGSGHGSGHGAGHFQEDYFKVEVHWSKGMRPNYGNAIWCGLPLH